MRGILLTPSAATTEADRLPIEIPMEKGMFPRNNSVGRYRNIYMDIYQGRIMPNTISSLTLFQAAV
jgi:hypothetical protein